MHRLTVVVILLTSLLPAPCRPLGAQVRYAVRPLPTDTLTHLRITVTTRGEADGTTRFALPEDRFGVNEMWRRVRNVEVGPGTKLGEHDGGVYELTHAPGAEIEVAYTVAYDPANEGFTPFGPSVDSRHFHFFGSQWMARVGAGKGAHDVTRDVEVVFERGDFEGAWGSSFGLGDGPHQVRATDYDLDYSVIAGGGYRVKTLECQGRPVLAAVHGTFSIGDDEIFELAGRIACGQREVFADFDRPFFTIFVTERDDLEAGAPLLNGFTAFLEASTSRDELIGLLAHEMSHTWLPRSARLVEADLPDAPESRTRWFHEGFTEYLSRVALVEQGLMPRSWMIERTNDDLERLVYQPYRTLTLDGLEAAGREGRYTGIHHRLHYVRGALLALNWDVQIRRASEGERSLADPVRLVLATAREGDGTIELETLMRIFEPFGVDAKGDVEQHLEGGRPIRPEPEAFGTAAELRTFEMPAFAPGFDVLHWLAESRVTGVRPGGPADRAGLRDGMAIARSGNAAPWFGRWDPSEPSVFLVEADPDSDGDGDEYRRFEVSAAGSPIEVPRYEIRGE